MTLLLSLLCPVATAQPLPAPTPPAPIEPSPTSEEATSAQTSPKVEPEVDAPSISNPPTAPANPTGPKPGAPASVQPELDPQPLEPTNQPAETNDDQTTYEPDQTNESDHAIEPAQPSDDRAQSADPEQPADEPTPPAPLQSVPASPAAPQAMVTTPSKVIDTAEQSADDDLDDNTSTFAKALAQLQSKVSWTGYGDLTVVYVPGEVFRFDAAHFNPILGVALSKRLWAELELEFEHAGSEIRVEYGILDYRFGSGATVRIGQFLLPIGQFNELLHPSFRWSQVSRPAMFRSVVPSVWSDVGIQLFGEVEIGSFAAVGYNLYVVNGLGVQPGVEFDPTSNEPARALVSNRLDSNLDKGLGGQARLRIGRGSVGDTTLRLSLYTGGVSTDETDRLTLTNVAFDTRLGPVHLNAEGSITFLDGERMEQGLYALASLNHQRTAFGVRWDHVDAALLGSATTTDAIIGSMKYAPHRLWNLRAEVSVPLNDPSIGFGGMSAFYF